MEFINRKIDRFNLTDIMKEDHVDNNIILLTGYTGVGKTGLIDYLFSKGIETKKCLRVHVSKTSVGTIESGTYFSALYKHLVEYSDKKRNIISPFEFGVINIRGIFRCLFGILKNLAHLNENDRLYEHSDTTATILKRDYIIEVLKQGNFIIDFENIQNIDTQSIELLNDIMKKTKGNTFVFEYTLTDNVNDLYNIYSELQHISATIQWYYLERMDFKEAIKLLPVPLNDEYKLAALKKIYENNHGNLMHIKLFNSERISESKDIIFDALDQLSSNERYVINIIYLNGGRIASNILMKLLTETNKSGRKTFSLSQYKKIQDHLEEKGIFEIQGSYFIIQNSISDHLANQSPSPALYNAYALLKDYYTDMRFKQADPDNWIYHLFSLYITFADSDISQILPIMRQVLLNCKYPQTILQKLHQFKEQLLNGHQKNLDVFASVCRLLTEVCIEIEDYENAKKNFEQIPTIKTDFSYDLLKAKLYALSSDENAIGVFENLEAQYPNGSSELLLIEICQLRLMLRICSQIQSEKFSEMLLKNDSYQKLPEYGFLLMNAAEIAASPQIAICMYKKAAYIFSKNKFLHPYVSLTLVNLSMSNGYIGNLDEARTNLEQAKKSRLNRAAYIFNNEATLDILEKACTEQTISKLEDSLLLTSNYFEQIIIKNNMLIANILCHRTKEAQSLCEEIELSAYEKYKYGEFLQMNYQNLLFYYRTIGNFHQVHFYEEKIDKLARSTTTSKNTKQLAILMKNGQKDDNMFYSLFPYRAEFLCYWGIPSQFYSLASENKY